MDDLFTYLTFPFVQYALIVGVLIALCSSLLGATLVLKRLSYIGDGLSHIAFGAIAVASVMKLTNATMLVFPVTALAAIFLLCLTQRTKIHGDAAIAMMSVASLAVGYLLLNVFSVSTNVSGDVCTTLFGATSILTLTEDDVKMSLYLSLFVMTMFISFYHRIFAITFDEVFARATGVKVACYNFLIAVTIAAVIVVAMNLVGSLLISALVVFPALSAMRLCHTYKGVILTSLTFSICCALSGMLISIAYATPVGATIVVMNVLVFTSCAIIASFKN